MSKTNTTNRFNLKEPPKLDDKDKLETLQRAMESATDPKIIKKLEEEVSILKQRINND